MFLDFFLAKKHIELPPAPLVPKGDPTLLFTSAGMVQFKDYYTSPPPPDRRRAVTIQKCLRASDLELVGISPRHHTFFEMLGNFSFGDYFKKEAAVWAWEFVTSVLGVPEDRLSATIYEEDDEAGEVWTKEVGLAGDLVIPLGKEDNWWGPAGATGPCGPCSEIHYDMGLEAGCGKPDCAPGCDCDRYIEVWNLVFPQYFQDEKAKLTPLPTPGIDTGMGLERLAFVMQGKRTVYETDLLAPVVEAVTSMAPGAAAKGAAEDAGIRTALRVIADHSRGLVFALSEGVLPSNEGRGYLLRRILRRAVRRGFDLGLDEPFLYKLAGPVADVMGESPRLYAYLGDRRSHVETVLRGEEERFFRTIEAGVGKFSEMAASLAAEGKGTFPGEWAFVLYDTYGFPPDMTREMAAEKGLSWDEDGLTREMEKQRQRARDASTFGAKSGGTREWTILNEARDSVFTGYVGEFERSRVMRYREGSGKDEIEVVLDKTPFYAESGGQVGDTGVLRWAGGEIEVVDTVRDGDSIVHVGRVSPVPDPFPDEVDAAVDGGRRSAIRRNHTATHLLHAALRKILGDHVSQSGSHVAPDRFRFDFSHYGPLNDKELEKVECEVNDAVRRNIPVETAEKSLEQAQKDGAIALFDEKYGGVVRQVSVGEVSSEVCGGTHVSSSGEIGPFVVASQSAVGSGVRRIEALTGDGAWKRLREEVRILKELEKLLGAQGEEAVRKARALIKERDRLSKAVASKRDKEVSGHASGLLDAAVDIAGAKVIIAEVPGAAIPELRRMGDQLRTKLGTGVAVLASVSGGKVSFMAAVTEDLVKDRKVNAGAIVSEVAKVAGGSGGGKPHLALAGAKNAGAVNKALEAARDIVKGALED
jgi:alanyl-tRNA synthetase